MFHIRKPSFLKKSKKEHMAEFLAKENPTPEEIREIRQIVAMSESDAL
jgi:hypothetical protein